jgi:hypothetical protein
MSGAAITSTKLIPHVTQWHFCTSDASRNSALAVPIVADHSSVKYTSTTANRHIACDYRN